MYLMNGINQDLKELPYNNESMAICRNCGRYGRYIVYMKFNVLTCFFIPLYKWKKQFFVQMSCCNTVFRLDPEIGNRIAAGENVQIEPEHLTPLGGGEQQ